MGETDPWRRRMRRTAERLRRLDARLFERQIARIEECLRRDATWNLEAALASCDRWRELRRWGRRCSPARPH
jgi:hypothetical protein